VATFFSTTIPDAIGDAIAKLGEFKEAIANALGEGPMTPEEAGKTVMDIRNKQLEDTLAGLSDQATESAAQPGDFATNFVAAVAQSFAEVDWSPVSSAIQSGLMSVMTSGGPSGPASQIAGVGGGVGVGAQIATGVVNDIAASFTPEAFAPIKTAFNSAMTAVFAEGAAQAAPEGQGSSTGQAIAALMVTDIAAAFTPEAFAPIKTAFDAAMTAAMAAPAAGGGEAGGEGGTGAQIALQLMTDIATGIGSNTTLVTTAVTTAMTAVSAAIGVATNQWISTMVTTMGAMGQAVSGGASQLTAAFTSAFASIGATIGTATNTMITTMSTTMGAMTSAVSSGMSALVSAITSGMQQATSAMQAQVTAMTTTLSNFATDATTAGQTAGEGFSSGLASGLAQAVAEASNAVQNVSTILNNAASGANAAGVAVGQGFADGIASMVGAVSAAASTLAGAALAGLAAPLILGSPSRAAFDIAISIPEGFVEALKAGVQPTMDAAGDFAESVLGKLKQDVKSGKTRGGVDETGWAAAAEDLIATRNPWAANLMREQNISISALITLDGEKMGEWTTNQTLGPMTQVHSRGGRRNARI
jgi:hypothetical protein